MEINNIIQSTLIDVCKTDVYYNPIIINIGKKVFAINGVSQHLEALAVHDGRTSFIVFLLADPHLLEGGQRGEDGTTDPDGVLAFWRSDNLDLHGGRSQGGDFLLHTVSDTRVHRGTTGQDNVSVEILTDVDVTLHDGVVGGLVDTTGFHTQERRLEQGFRTTESLVTDGDHLTVR